MKLTPIKYQEGWLYVDKSVDKHNGLFYVNGGIGLSVGVHEGEMPKNDYCSKVVAQRNLSLPNIPYIEEVEDVDAVANRCFEEMKNLNPKGGLKEFIRQAVHYGYKAAQSKGGYSEDDLRAAFRAGECYENNHNYLNAPDEDAYIQSLNQPKEIEIEMYNGNTNEPIQYLKDGKTFLKVKQ